MTSEQAISYLENMKWLKGYNNTTVNGKSLDGVIDGIIELLKVQEPRVMTIEEVTEDCPDVVWFDDRHFVSVFAALPKNENYHGWVKFIWRDGYERHDHIDGYGKEWRCWTSRPTDKQREAVKWE